MRHKVGFLAGISAMDRKGKLESIVETKVMMMGKVEQPSCQFYNFEEGYWKQY